MKGVLLWMRYQIGMSTMPARTVTTSSVDANNVLQVLPAAQRIGDGLAKAVTDLEETT